MRIALQTITGSTYTSDDIDTVLSVEQADETIEHILSAGYHYTSMEINGRTKFFPMAHVVWMQAVK